MLFTLLALLASAAVIPAQAQPRPTFIEAHEGTFRVKLSDGSERTGTALKGMVLVYESGLSPPVRIRVAGLRPDPEAKSGDILLHDFRDAETGEPICMPGPDGTREGFAVAGRSDASGTIRPGDPGQFELVCTSGAQGKCIRFGYAPWKPRPDGGSMPALYNACIRMVRADYCGDGAGTTKEGQEIDIFDSLGIQKADTDLPLEAAWTEAGAACVAHTRVPENMTLARLAETCPRLAGKLGPAACPAQAGEAKLFVRSKRRE